MSAYDYLHNCHVGDKIEASTQRDFSSPLLGEITNVSGQCCNVRCVTDSGVPVFLDFCWHIDDPRLDIPGKFEKAQKRNTDDTDGTIFMGLFRFAPAQQALNQITPKVDRIDAVVEQLAFRVESLERKDGSVESLERKIDDLTDKLDSMQQELARRKPGRPRLSQKTADALAVSSSD